MALIPCACALWLAPWLALWPLAARPGYFPFHYVGTHTHVGLRALIVSLRVHNGAVVSEGKKKNLGKKICGT